MKTAKRQIETATAITRYFEDTEDFKDASVGIIAPNFEGDPYRVVMCHKCWTGHEWFSICNPDEGFGFEHAVEVAKTMVQNFVDMGLKPSKGKIHFG
jgi:hypothetical protein